MTNLKLSNPETGKVSDSWEMIWFDVSFRLITPIYDHDNDESTYPWNLSMRRYFPKNFNGNDGYYELKVVLRRLIEEQLEDLNNVTISEIAHCSELHIRLIAFKPSQYTQEYLQERLNIAINSANAEFCNNFSYQIK